MLIYYVKVSVWNQNLSYIFYEARVSVCILGVFCSFFFGGGGDDVMHNQEVTINQ